MSSALQNRLVGTIIVVALAVIFLPDILDGKKQSYQETFVDLPERPAMGPIEQAKSFSTQEVQQSVAVKEQVVPDVATDDFELPVEPSSSEQSIAVDIDRQVVDPAEQDDAGSAGARKAEPDTLLEDAGWVVQLGVFRHQKNVRELLNTLKGAGYRAFSRPVKTSSGELTKVFVGPELQKQKLEKAVPHLKELTKLQGRITPFTVK